LFFWLFHAAGRTKVSLLRKGFGQMGQGGGGTQPGQQLNGSKSWTAASSGSRGDHALNCHEWGQMESLAPSRRKRIVEYD